jgi:hypothetical protein
MREEGEEWIAPSLLCAVEYKIRSWQEKRGAVLCQLLVLVVTLWHIFFKSPDDSCLDPSKPSLMAA